MKLEKEHAAPYLPFGVLGKSERGSIYRLNIYSNMRSSGIEDRTIDSFLNEQYKLILHPLSDLTKEIEVNGERFVPADIFCIEYGGGVQGIGKKKFKENFIDNILYSPIGVISFEIVQKLFEWHFDVFGLISEGLAIDINTLNQNI